MMAGRYRRRLAALDASPPAATPASSPDRLFALGTLRRMFWIPAVEPAFAPVPAAALVERYRLIPYRTIRIDGDFGDWDGVPPVITANSTGNYRQLRGWKPATEIEAVYLAQDDSFFYVRYVLSDGTITTATQPEYKTWFQPDSSTRDQIGMQVRWAPWNSRWQTVVFQWSEAGGWNELSTLESVRVVDNTFEARFPRRGLDRQMTLGRTYQMHTDTFSSDHAAQQWWHHHALRAPVVY
jgi:hypothetical protein